MYVWGTRILAKPGATIEGFTWPTLEIWPPPATVIEWGNDPCSSKRTNSLMFQYTASIYQDQDCWAPLGNFDLCLLLFHLAILIFFFFSYYVTKNFQMSISLSVKTAIYYIFLCSMHIQLLMWVKLWWVFNVCIGDIIVHMEPQGFMKILAGLVPQLNIWKNILHMAVFFHLRVWSPRKNFERIVARWKE